MTYYDFEPETDEQRIGHAIYKIALSSRRGFRDDQIGIEDDEIWREIFQEMGDVAKTACAPHPLQRDMPGESSPPEGWIDQRERTYRQCVTCGWRVNQQTGEVRQSQGQSAKIGAEHG